MNGYREEEVLGKSPKMFQATNGTTSEIRKAILEQNHLKNSYEL
jgi:hypothetical protein